MTNYLYNKPGRAKLCIVANIIPNPDKPEPKLSAKTKKNKED